MSNKRYNMWLSLSTGFRTEFNQFVQNGTPPVQFPEIANLSEHTVAFFQTTYDLDAWERITQNWNAAGRTYQLFSLYANKPDHVNTIRADLDGLAASYPQDFSLSGAWHYEDGRSVGTQWDDSEPPMLTGDAWYKTPQQVVNMMPPVWNGDDPPTYSPATDLDQCQLVFGQAPRIWAKDGW